MSCSEWALLGPRSVLELELELELGPELELELELEPALHAVPAIERDLHPGQHKVLSSCDRHCLLSVSAGDLSWLSQNQWY